MRQNEPYVAAVTTLSIDIWSDIACPWCYVGKRRLEAALKRFPHQAEVQVTWHAFELDPGAPRERDESLSYSARLAKKYGTSVPQAEQMIARMTKVAAEDGLEFRFDRIRPGNTFDAHRVIHLAKLRGRQDAVKERLLRAYMTEGAAIGRVDVLTTLAAEAGLDADEVSGMLATDLHTDAVREDEREAQALGISGVPFFVLAERYALSGAQPSEVFERALNEAWSALEPKPQGYAEGAVCGPDGCV
jgi:predicted DsbA family dithiol-disulfide isomerase